MANGTDVLTCWASQVLTNLCSALRTFRQYCQRACYGLSGTCSWSWNLPYDHHDRTRRHEGGVYGRQHQKAEYQIQSRTSDDSDGQQNCNDFEVLQEACLRGIHPEEQEKEGGRRQWRRYSRNRWINQLVL